MEDSNSKETKLSMKLLVDTKANKVLYAEAEKEFVDFLFHIMALPIGTDIKLLKTSNLNMGIALLKASLETQAVLTTVFLGNKA